LLVRGGVPRRLTRSTGSARSQPLKKSASICGWNKKSAPEISGTLFHWV